MSAQEPLPGVAPRGLVAGQHDELILEEPLLLQIGDSSLLTMRTPGDEIPWAIGFLYGEGWLAPEDPLPHVRFLPGKPGEADRVEVDISLTETLKASLQRTHEIRPSCGICGSESADKLLEGIAPLVAGRPKLKASSIEPMAGLLQAHQPLFKRTGGCHGALVCNPEGEVITSAEDVGRHNALDKALGKALLAGVDLSRCVVVLSGRAGYELIIKCLRLRCPIIISVSAPTALAFDLCRGAGATLAAFVRPGNHKVFWDAGRVEHAP